MEQLHSITTEAAEKWMNGTLTKDRSFEIQRELQIISDQVQIKSGVTYWQYLKVAQIADIWRDLLRNGLVQDITPYSKGKILDLTLELVEGQGILIDLASKIILQGLLGSQDLNKDSHEM